MIVTPLTRTVEKPYFDPILPFMTAVEGYALLPTGLETGLVLQALDRRRRECLDDEERQNRYEKLYAAFNERDEAQVKIAPDGLPLLGEAVEELLTSDARLNPDTRKAGMALLKQCLAIDGSTV